MKFVDEDGVRRLKHTDHFDDTLTVDVVMDRVYIQVNDGHCVYLSESKFNKMARKVRNELENLNEV